MGGFSKLTGISIDTLRYYEKEKSFIWAEIRAIRDSSRRKIECGLTLSSD
ncbi:MerR family DNA-binding transcriptional regulator [Sporolactobacillus shoreicorticis]|uniref:MerR family DNA-binding transcriptional regulator n=1 Tax=Sporolactobacillus shoreicorticis TaxID=1923877 RepID=A0ABW5S1Q4_9BACL